MCNEVVRAHLIAGGFPAGQAAQSCRQPGCRGGHEATTCGYGSSIQQTIGSRRRG